MIKLYHKHIKKIKIFFIFIEYSKAILFLFLFFSFHIRRIIILKEIFNIPIKPKVLFKNHDKIK